MSKDLEDGSGHFLATPEHLAKWAADTNAAAAYENSGKLHSSLPAQEVDVVAALKTQLRGVYEIDDAVERGAAFAQVMGSRDAIVAKAQVTALEQAKKEFHVRELEQMYNTSLEEDKRDPYWDRFKVPSPITEKIQEQIIRASTAARAAAQEYFLANSEVQSITKSLDPEFKRFEQINAMKEKEALKLAETEGNLLLYGKATTDLAKLLIPELNVKDPDPAKQKVNELRIAHTTNKLMQNKNFAEVIFNADPNSWLPMAVNGNDIAARALVDKQAKAAANGRTDTPEYEVASAKAREDVNFIVNFAHNPALREKVLTDMYPKSGGKDNPKLVKLLQSYHIDPEDKSAEGQKGRIAAFTSMANQILADRNKAAFEGDVASWTDSSAFHNPKNPVGKLYEMARKNLGDNSKIGLQNLAANIRDLPKEERAFAQMELTNMAKRSLTKYSGAYIGRFSDNFNAEIAVQQYMVGGLSTWASRLLQIGQRTGTGIGTGAVMGGALGAAASGGTLAVPGAVAGGVTGGAVGAATGLYETLADIFKE